MQVSGENPLSENMKIFGSPSITLSVNQKPSFDKLIRRPKRKTIQRKERKGK
jgi:hypothetical protein